VTVVLNEGIKLLVSPRLILCSFIKNWYKVANIILAKVADKSSPFKNLVISFSRSSSLGRRWSLTDLLPASGWGRYLVVIKIAVS